MPAHACPAAAERISTMTTKQMLSIQQLSHAAFQDFGTFGALTPPTATPLVRGDVISFWPDCGGVLTMGPSGNNQLAIGICQAQWRPLQVDVCEYHTATGEGILPLDGDIYLHVGRPTGDDTVPVDALEIFFVPKGTIVVLKPGVWHHAPFATKPGETVNTVIMLPQRVYANDCIVRELDPPVPFSN